MDLKIRNTKENEENMKNCSFDEKKCVSASKSLFLPQQTKLGKHKNHSGISNISYILHFTPHESATHQSYVLVSSLLFS